MTLDQWSKLNGSSNEDEEEQEIDLLSATEEQIHALGL